MVQNNHWYNQWRNTEDKDDVEANHFGFDNNNNHKRARPKLFYFVFLSFLSWCLILASQLVYSPSTFSLIYSYWIEDDGLISKQTASICSSVSNGTICCDRSSIRSDICLMKGDVRTDSASSSVFLYRHISGLFEDEHKVNKMLLQHEKIKPYTRKWEGNAMNLVSELDLIVKEQNSSKKNRVKCDVQHDVPAVFFSTGGYTGNAYHDINDGILPLFITSQHLNKKVVFVVLDYHDWWFTKYADVLAQLSDYPVINFNGDNRIHCFPEAIVGLRIHDELSIDPLLMNKTIVDFRNLLDRAYWPRINGLIKAEERKTQLEMNKLSLPSSSSSSSSIKKPKLTIISRNGSREITNEKLLVKMSERMGFSVKVLRPDRTTELAKLYRDLNSSDVMIGVHGAAMTYLLFMNPESVFIQIMPLGLVWPAQKYYEEPAKKLGLKYIGYKILPNESSLYDEYGENDPVLNDPDMVNKKGWEFTKKIYLDHQKVQLNLPRFQKRLVRAYNYSIAKKNSDLHLHQTQ